MRGRKKVQTRKGAGEVVDGYRDPEKKALLDIPWIIYVGMQAGYTETEVAHMYYSKWQQVYKQFQRHHNMVITKKVYKGA